MGKVCNVADLPGEGLQCCRSSGGRSAMLQTLRGEVCKGEGLQYNTGTNSDGQHIVANDYLLHQTVCISNE